MTKPMYFEASFGLEISLLPNHMKESNQLCYFIHSEQGVEMDSYRNEIGRRFLFPCS